MSEKRHSGESFESYVERLIREAEAEGAFRNLPGAGLPIPSLEGEWDENSWIREKLKREQINLLPPSLALKLEIEKTLDHLAELPTEESVRGVVQTLNAKILEINASPHPSPAVLMPMEVDEIVIRWRHIRGLT